MTTYEKLEREVTESIVVCANKWVSERSTSRIDRVRLTWLFAKATLAAAGTLFHTVLDVPMQEIPHSPVVRCLREYSAIARSKENHG